MNDFQNIKKEVEQKLSRELGEEVTCSIEKINKQGGITYTGLTVKSNTGSVCPIFNLDELRERGLDVKEMRIFIVDKYLRHQIEEEGQKKILSCLSNYEEAKKRLVIRCCNLPNNISYLSDKPYRKITRDIVAYLIIHIGDMMPDATEKVATTSVTSSLLKTWGVSFEEAYKVALMNGFKPYIGDLLEMQTSYFTKDFLQPLREFELIQHISPELPPLFVISNQKQVGGASILAYPEVLKMLSDFFAMDLMVIPSSVHEILVLPFVEGHTSAKSTIVDEVSSMIQEVNATSVAEEDILSSTAYLLRNGVLLDIETALTA